MALCRAPRRHMGWTRPRRRRARRPPPGAKVKSLLGESTPRAWSRPARADPDRAPRGREGDTGPAAGGLRRRVADDLATLQAGGSLAAGIEASPPRIEMSREPARPAE